ncbi:hypothetical protein Lepto7376_3770 [[Leptolyngbya] sp. PCC 7376]|uniref:hypothetical protein n=1 Tax=[Leptolyngbya] sp. PCC 7376 TaxID=111781 RepID=UPI00029EF0A2|nr:hypothetical protein [[Leptolyngbya] sp. PCC 7376]AFY39936.1 hypothetical protein Lepto7376_3770 [[Leptolyngbya] sp. PCC 7376]
MDTSDFLRDSILGLEKDLKETQQECQHLRGSVTKLDKHLAILETKITTKAKNQSAWIAFFVALALQITSILVRNTLE